MKRTDREWLREQAAACFASHGWALPPNPKWDITDFGLGDWRQSGLVLVNLAEEPEYCEKLMYARAGMVTPAHHHGRKKEDIIARWGSLAVQVWDGPNPFSVRICGEPRLVQPGEAIELAAGERITLVPGVIHAFWPLTPECIIGEVSTANDDENDNFFVNPEVGRFPVLEE